MEYKAFLSKFPSNRSSIPSIAYSAYNLILVSFWKTDRWPNSDLVFGVKSLMVIPTVVFRRPPRITYQFLFTPGGYQPSDLHRWDCD